MRKNILTALVALTLTTAAFAQQGPLRRAGQALDRAGKNIRGEVEGAVVRGQVSAQERETLGRVTQRINWDKRLSGTTLQIVVEVDGTVYLRGSVANAVAKAMAVDLAQNTIGVTRVVDELAIVKEVKVIEAPTVVVPPSAKVVVPVESEVIIKP